MAYQPINVRQPLPEDLVDDPVGVSGVGTGFEGTFTARVRDGNGTELGSTTIHAGGDRAAVVRQQRLLAKHL